MSCRNIRAPLGQTPTRVKLAVSWGPPGSEEQPVRLGRRGKPRVARTSRPAPRTPDACQHAHTVRSTGRDPGPRSPLSSHHCLSAKGPARAGVFMYS